MVLTGVFDIQLVPVFDITQTFCAWRRPRVPAVVATGADTSYQYRLQHEVVLLA